MIRLNGKNIEVGSFPDGTPNIKLPAFIAGDNVVITWLFDNMSELFSLRAIKDKLDTKYKDIKLFMPYIPNARMDRVKNDDEVFTLKSFANIINDMRFSQVVVDNAHSNVSLALINNVVDTVNVSVERFIKSEKIKFDTIMFPDEGACKRYSDFDCVKEFNCVTGMKKRNWRTGEILGLEVIGDMGDISGKDILIIDDICSRGGTFKYSALKLKQFGASNIYLYISHCENVIDIPSLKEAGITKVFTTNSIYRGDDDFIEIV